MADPVALVCSVAQEVEKVEEWTDVELEAVSREQLSKLEENLKKATA
jgi:hypothetical protein